MAGMERTRTVRLRHGILVAAAVVLSANAPSLDDLKARAKRMPKTVTAFIERRAYCNHFLGEEPYDRKRAAELNRTIRELSCSRIDRDERVLRRTFRKRPAVLQLLDDTADALSW